jgi:hypothetical protein
MQSNGPVPIPTEQFPELANFLQSNNDRRDSVEMVAVGL